MALFGAELMNYGFTKEKLCKGESYAFGRPLLDKSLAENGIESIVNIGYWVKTPYLAWESGCYRSNVLLKAFYAGLGTAY